MFLFKYFTFAINNVNRILDRLDRDAISTTFDFVLPVGISFYIFQAMGYVIDVYKEKVPVEKNIFRYALFISFFPQLVAGPIERTGNMMKQLEKGTDFNIQKVRSGLILMLWGLFLKVVLADNIAPLVTDVYNNYAGYTGTHIVIATMLFAVQIYCDFGGYSYIAIGSAEVLGYKLMDNFKCPYFARTVTEFWRRWHISLTSWFTDYVYIPLGGNRKGIIRKYVNTLVVFGLSGAWHGASWHYIVWGVINGIFIIIEKASIRIKRLFIKLIHVNPSSWGYKIASRIITFCLICFTWLFFRANGFLAALEMLKKCILNLNLSVLLTDSKYFGMSTTSVLVIVGGILLLLLVDLLKNKGIDLRKSILRQNFLVRYALYIFLIAIIIIYGNYGGDYAQTKFIYFQF